MSAIDDFPISLRAWPRKDDKADALTTLIQRINHERGGFRNITEESLNGEIERKAHSSAAQNGEDEDMDNDDSEDDDDPAKDIVKSKTDMIARLESAHWASIQALDFVSILLSSHNPVQASQTISPGIRDLVGLGTLGADRLSESRTSIVQRDDSRNVANSWKLQSVRDNADAIIEAASQLTKEGDSESSYWQDVVDISTRGWSVCELPWDPKTLGVRFGFRDSASQFVSRNVAALRRNAEGGLKLDHGLFEAAPKQFRVRIRQKDKTTGQYMSQSVIHGESDPHDLVLQARDAIFEEELWQEIHREGRNLYNQGVCCDADEIRYQVNTGCELVLDLVHPEQLSNPFNSTNEQHNRLASIVWISLHILLSQAHKDKYRRRSQKPPPVGAGAAANPAYSLLRPILAHLKHLESMNILERNLKALSRALMSAGITDTATSYTTVQPQIDSANPLATFIHTLEASFILPLVSESKPEPSDSLIIKMRTVMFPIVESRFQIIPSGKFAKSCPAPAGPSLDDTLQYIAWAACCACADHCMRREKSLWTKTVNPTIVRQEAIDLASTGKELSFHIELGNSSGEVNGHVGQDAEIRDLLQMVCRTTQSIATVSKSNGVQENSVPIKHVWSSASGQPEQTLNAVVGSIESVDGSGQE